MPGAATSPRGACVHAGSSSEGEPESGSRAGSTSGSTLRLFANCHHGDGRRQPQALFLHCPAVWAAPAREWPCPYLEERSGIVHPARLQELKEEVGDGFVNRKLIGQSLCHDADWERTGRDPPQPCVHPRRRTDCPPARTHLSRPRGRLTPLQGWLQALLDHLLEQVGQAEILSLHGWVACGQQALDALQRSIHGIAAEGRAAGSVSTPQGFRARAWLPCSLPGEQRRWARVGPGNQGWDNVALASLQHSDRVFSS